MKPETDHIHAIGSLTVVLTMVLLLVAAGGVVPAHAQEQPGGREGGGVGVQYSVMTEAGLALVRPGADEAGSERALLFERAATGGGWMLADHNQAVAAENRRFSYAVAVDGDRAVVGAEWRDGFGGGAVVLQKTDGGWVVEQRLVPSDPGRYDHFGGSVAIHGDVIVVGAPWHDLFQGAVYVFRPVDGSWKETQKLTVADQVPAQEFGDLVSLSGNAIVVRDTGSDVFTEESIRASGVLDLIALVDKGGEGPPLRPTAAPPAPASLMATDAALEDRVELTWASVGMDAIVYKVLRDGQLLSVVSSDETQWSDLTGVLGVTYEYCVLVKDMADQESAPTCDDGSRIIFAPMNVSATDGEYTDGVWINWVDLSAINTGYSIRREGMALGSAGPNASSFQDTTGVTKTTYSYEVVATVDGYESAPGTDTGWRATILPPLDVVASDGQYLDRVRITWVGQEPMAQAYRIYRDGALIDSTAATVTTYVDTLVSFGQTYTYCVATKVVAVTGIGQAVLQPASVGGDESIHVCDPGSIGLMAPANVSASDSTYDDRIRITWEDHSDFEDGFEIRRVAFGDSVVLDTVGVGTTYYNDYAAGPDTTYTYFVRAVNDLGGVSPDSSDTGYRATVLAPTDIAASDGTFEDHVDITWKSTSTTAVLFKIYRNGTMIKSVSRGDRMYSDYGGTAGEIYDYGVAAVTALEAEALGEWNQGRRELLAPSNISASDDEFEEKVVISWTDHSRIEMGYQVTRHDTAGVEPDTTFSIGPNRASHTDYCGTPGVVYSYSAAAFDSANGIVGHSVSGQDLGRRILLAPTNVHADKGVGETEIVITWRDNSDAEDGYRIYRDSLPVGTVDDNSMSFSDSSPVLGQTHDYEVRAYDAYGMSASAADSGYSTILSPISFNASDTYENRLWLTWVDRSAIEDGFKIYRDGYLLKTVPTPNVTTYSLDYDLHGALATPGSAECVIIDGQYAYVGDASAGLQIVDISNPVMPQLVGSYPTSSHPYDIAVENGYAFVAQATSLPDTTNVEIIDVRDPAAPTFAGRYSGNDATGVFVTGQYLYLAAGNFTIINVADPSNPALVWEFDTQLNNFYSATDVVVVNEYAYVSFDGNGMYYDGGVVIFDVSDPENPAWIGGTRQPYYSAVNSISVDGDYAYIARGASGFDIFDVSDPISCALVDQYGTSDFVHSVVALNHQVYAAVDTAGLQVIDATDPTAPQPISTYNTPGTSYGLALADGYVYVADGSAGLEAISDPVSGAGIQHEYCIAAFKSAILSESACNSGVVPRTELDLRERRVDEKLTASDGAYGDRLGISVSTSGTRLIAGADKDNSNIGAAYVFNKADDQWTQNKLTAADGAVNDWFGFSVSTSGTWAIIGARGDDDKGSNSGSAYMFSLGDGGWSQFQKLTADDGVASGGFGTSVCMSGEYAIVGSPGAMAAYIFERDHNTGSWIQQKIVPIGGSAGDQFGNCVSIDGEYAIVGAPFNDDNGYGMGAAYVFERNEVGTWIQMQELTSAEAGGEWYEGFGTSVCISGDQIIVGAQEIVDATGAAYIFQRDENGVWVRIQKLRPIDGKNGDSFGQSVSISGRLALVASPNNAGRKGAVYVFEESEGLWKHGHKLTEGGDLLYGEMFGTSVSIFGSHIAVGAFWQGAISEGPGKVCVDDLTPPPAAVVATDASQQSRVRITWLDQSDNERGFRIYRDGEPIATVGPNVQGYDDFDAEPGRLYEYAVSSVIDDMARESILAPDFGWRPANGNVTGRVSTRAGNASEGIRVSVSPLHSNSLLLDEQGGYVEIPDTAGTFDFSGSDNFSIELWFKCPPVGSPGPDGALVAKAAPGSGAERYPFLLSNQRSTDQPGRLRFSISDSATTVSVSTVTTNLDDNAWHHVTCVRDATRDSIYIYVDGGFEDGFSCPGLEDLANGEPVSIGAGPASGSWFGGLVDDVRIWRIARSPSQVRASMAAYLAGNESGLVGYWPVGWPGGWRDPASSGLIADLAPLAHYGLFHGGVYRSEDCAPLEIHPLTDEDGNYVVNNIFYGTEAEFEVRPYGGNRLFDPPVKRISLTTASPVENQVNFVDISSFTVSGAVRYAGTECPAADVPILVDGQAVDATDTKGKFAVGVTLGEHWIRPDVLGHRFEPESLFVNVTRDTVINDSTGVAFSDSTTYLLSGRLGGGCGRPVGAITLTIRSETDCLLQTLDFAPDDTVYSLALPPQNYLVSASVDPSTIPAGLSMTDVVRYFQNLGARLAELDSLDVTMDFVYRAPLRVTIRGLESYVETCDGPLAFGNRTLPDGLPVVPQLTVLPLTIEVDEDYGTAGLCPLDSGTVIIYDEIFDRENDPFELTVFNGVAACTTFASTPSLVIGRTDEYGNDRTFQKAFTAVVDVEGRTRVTETTWALVTGHVQPEGADFVTATTQMPLYILRDPPGDNSSAFLEEGLSIRTRTEWDRTVDMVSGGLKLEVWTGVEAKWFVGIGAGTISGVNFRKPWTTDVLWGNQWYEESATNITFRSAERFATSSDAAFIGENGDVFVGCGYNFLFSEVGRIDVEDCVVAKTTEVGFQPESIKTAYAYSERYVHDVLIPEMESKIAGFNDLPDLGEEEAARRDSLQIGLDFWRFLLAKNDTLKMHASPVQNRSYSAGAGITYSQAQDTTRSYTWKSTFFVDDKTNAGGFLIGSDYQGLSLSILANSRHEMMNRSYKDPVDTSGTVTTAVGYTLNDDDIGDHFTVDIKNDGVFPSPVFDVRAGVSSCPYEPWPDTTGTARMMPRDKPRLFVSPIRRDAVSPEEAAAFTLTLANLSPTEESRLYVLRLLNTSNPDGAIVKVGGVPLSNGLSYEIDPEQSQRATLTVERGPTAYQYDDLALVLYSPCEITDMPYPRPSGSREQSSALADTFKFSVTFDAPCSDVTLTLPEPGWTFTQADQDSGVSVLMLLSDYEFHVSEDDSIQSVWGQYRHLGVGREGPSEWVSIAAESLGTTETLIAWSPPETLEDGVYELRAYTQCIGGKAYSGAVTGTIERHGPQVLGTPEPADGELSFGEDISIAFNELIDCRSVTADSVTLTYLDGPSTGLDIPLETVCDEATIVINPTADPADLEGRRLKARVAGVTDKAGNPMTRAVAWEFEVRRSRFTWSRLHLNADVPYRDPGSITADLVNGTGQPVDFTITDVPAWVTMANPAEGTIPASEKQTVTLTLEDTLSIGQYEGEVRAAADDTTQGVAVFDLVVTVSCHEPEWVVEPSDFEHTMTMVAQLDIGGEISTDPDDRVSAFVGNQLRGVASLQEVPVGTPPYPYLAFLTVYSNRVQDETVRFQVWDADSCRHYDTTLESYPFVANSSIGSTGAPVTLTAVQSDGSGALTIAVNQGWTWISTNRTSADMSVNGVLSDLTPVPGDLIKSQTAFSQFVADSTGWSGGLTNLDNRSCYMIRLSEPGAIVHDGTWANVPVPVQQGWNWVGYLPQGPIDVTDALMNLGGLATVGDVVKSQSGFAEYTGGGWYGSLQVMEPGNGYKLHLASGVITSFTYPVYVPPPPEAPGLLAGTGGSEALDFGTPAAGLAEGMPAWSVDPHAYEHTMTVTAVLNITGSESIDDRDRVAAFVGDACRGVTGPIQVDGVGRHEVFLMVHSNEVAGEQVTLRAFDAGTGLVYEIDETMAFEADGIVGEVQSPLVLNARSVWDGGKVPQVFTLAQNRPNPFSASTAIAYDVPSDRSHVTIRIYDVTGRLVRTLVDRIEAQGKQEVTWDRLSDRGRRVRAGVYFYRMTASGFDKARRMIIIR